MGALAVGASVAVLVAGLVGAAGVDIENFLVVRLSITPFTLFIAGLVYVWSCRFGEDRGKGAGLELGVVPGHRGAWPLKPRSFTQSLGAVLLATLALIVASIAITKFIELLGLNINEQENIVELTAPVNGAMNPAIYALAPVALLAAPLLEEILFRRLYFRRLLVAVGAVPAFVASAAAFAAIHGNPTGVPIYLLQALIFGGVYRYTGRLSAAIAVHFLNNLITLAMLISGAGA